MHDLQLVHLFLPFPQESGSRPSAGERPRKPKPSLWTREIRLRRSREPSAEIEPIRPARLFESADARDRAARPEESRRKFRLKRARPADETPEAAVAFAVESEPDPEPEPFADETAEERRGFFGRRRRDEPSELDEDAEMRDVSDQGDGEPPRRRRSLFRRPHDELAPVGGLEDVAQSGDAPADGEPAVFGYERRQDELVDLDGEEDQTEERSFWSKEIRFRRPRHSFERAEEAEPVIGPDAASAETPIEEEPAEPKRRRVLSRRPKEEPELELVAGAEGVAADEEQPEPKRRRLFARKQEEPELDAVAGPDLFEDEQYPEPKHRRLFGRKPKEERELDPVADAERVAADEEQLEPKRRRLFGRTPKEERELDPVADAERVAADEEQPEPKHRRLFGRKPKEERELDPVATTEAVAADEEQPEPKRRRLFGRKPKEEPELDLIVEAGAFAVDEERPEPKRRRLFARKQEEPELDAVAGPDLFEDEQQPEPKHRRLFGRKPKEDPELDLVVEAGAFAADEEAPEPKRRRLFGREPKGDTELEAVAEPDAFADGEQQPEPKRRTLFGRKPAEEPELDAIAEPGPFGDGEQPAEPVRRGLFRRAPKAELQPELDAQSSAVEAEDLAAEPETVAGDAAPKKSFWSTEIRFGRRRQDVEPIGEPETAEREPVRVEAPHDEQEATSRRRLFGRKPKPAHEEAEGVAWEAEPAAAADPSEKKRFWSKEIRFGRRDREESVEAEGFVLDEHQQEAEITPLPLPEPQPEPAPEPELEPAASAAAETFAPEPPRPAPELVVPSVEEPAVPAAFEHPAERAATPPATPPADSTPAEAVPVARFGWDVPEDEPESAAPASEDVEPAPVARDDADESTPAEPSPRTHVAAEEPTVVPPSPTAPVRAVASEEPELADTELDRLPDEDQPERTKRFSLGRKRRDTREEQEGARTTRRRARRRDEQRDTDGPPARGKHGKKQIVGLKIGASQVAAAYVSNNGTPELLQVAREPLEQGIVVGGELRDPEALAEALATFFKKHKLPRRGVRLGLSSNRIGVRSFDLSGIEDPKQLTNAVRFRAQDALPIPLNEAALDYQVLEEAVDADGVTHRRVLLVVAYRDLVDRYVDACRKAGLKLIGVDLEAFAALRALAAPRPEEEEPNGALVVVAIGHDRSTLAVSDGRVCEFTRVLDWGGSALDVAIARALDITPTEAEPIKRRLSLGAQEDAVEDATPERSAKVREAAVDQLQGFARELVSSLHFYQSQPGSLEIAEVVLTGGGAHVAGLASELERLTGVRVRVGDPLVRVKMGKKLTPPQPLGSLAVAIGLGIED